ncbi:MAG: L-rhamnose mutarotase [Mucilaginibacter sp.]|jgi:hypothetical protein
MTASINRRSSKYWVAGILFVAALLSFSKADAISSPFAAVEIIAPVGKTPDTQAALLLCKKHHWPQMAVYRWNNHLVIYGELRNVSLLKNEVSSAYGGYTIKVYQNPFYDFDRKQHCGNEGIAKEWDNVLLTADLVKDPKLQQEYLNYHANQFKRWPEVANGFCNADFQQLLVFKNGRQLMLIISIPKGKTLDKLNPLTTKNNPRVDDWNKLMSKYQEGIPGTKPGEAWVFLKPVDHK